MINCENCGNKLRQEANFCPFCGEDAPRLTIILDKNYSEITDGIFCPHCGEKNITEATYCQINGEQIYKIPENGSLYCPKCKKKNSTKANFCPSCNTNLNNWFKMQDKITTNLAYKKSFIFTETMNQLSYHFITEKQFSIGRTKNNNLVNPCSWISSLHCKFDFTTGYLIDNKSSNGLFVNRNNSRVDKINIDQINELNLADSFTYNIINHQKLFVLKLGAILEGERCKSCGLKEKCNQLKNHFYIFVLGDGEIIIQKKDGNIVTKREPDIDYFSIEIKNGFYYFNDNDNDIKDRLLKKRHNVLQKNWKIEFPQN